MSAITAAELLLKYSVAAAAGNTTAGTAATSLGDQISTTSMPDATLNALFDDLTGAENAAAGVVDYRCLFVHNSNASNAAIGVKVYLSAEVASGAAVSIAADSTAASAIGSGSTQALTAASETAPGSPITSLTYTSPTTLGAGIVLGDIPAGSCRAFWIRRTTANTAAVSADGVTFSVGCDTGSL